MRRLRWAGLTMVLMASACGSAGSGAATPTAVPAATSYVAPLRTVAPTAQVTTVPTPQPEDITPPPSIITVEPAIETTLTPQP